MAGVVQFIEDNIKSNGPDFPKLKLDQGESARIVVLEDPLMTYIHDLKRPRIVNGQPQTVVEERKNGEKYTDYMKDFVSRPLCLGDEGILAERGSDPAHCPICKLASESDMVEAPKRRFAMHVIRYATRPGTTDIQLPFQVSTVVWSFTDTIFTKLVTFKKENPQLREHDLLLGPCTNKGFQKFDINISTKAEWLVPDPDEIDPSTGALLLPPGTPTRRQQLVHATFTQNQAPDLEALCGRRTQAHWIEEDLNKVRDAWQIVNGFGNQPRGAVAPGFDQAQLQQSLGGLLDQATVVGQPAADPWQQLAGGPQFAPAAGAGLPQPVPTVVGAPDQAAQFAAFQAQQAQAAAAAQLAAQLAAQQAAAAAQPVAPPVDPAFAAWQAQQAAQAPVAQVPTAVVVPQFIPPLQAVPVVAPQPVVPVAGFDFGNVGGAVAPQPQVMVPPMDMSQMVSTPTVEQMAAPVQQVAPPVQPLAQPPVTPGVVTSFDDLLKGV